MEALQQLESQLKGHDWFYQYADDPRAYRRGSEERQEILQTVRDLHAQGLGPEADELFNKYRRS